MLQICWHYQGPFLNTLPEISVWKPGVDVVSAERRVAFLRGQILQLAKSIEEQQRKIAAEGLPVDQKFELANFDAMQRELENELAALMAQRDFEILNFALDGRPFESHRAGAKALSMFLDRLQRLFERVGQAVSSTRYTPVVPHNIRDACRLEIAGFYPSSFGVRFTTRTNVDFSGSSISSNALDATFDLINAEQPIEQAAKLGNVVLTNYRNLVKTLVEVEASPKAKWKTSEGLEREWVC